MSKVLDWVINALRWLAAMYLLLSVPALLEAYSYFNFFTLKFYALGVGILFFAFTLIAAGYNMRRSMQIIAHELTHSLFAFLTFHKVGRIRLNPDGSGGSMQLKGHGNWLITLAPYFFPLFAFFYMLVMPVLAEVFQSHLLLYAILGYFLAYYWSTVLSQVHVNQPDIIAEGYGFSAMVIVGANLYVTGMILAFCSQFWHGIGIFLALVNRLNLAYLQQLAAYF